MQRLTRQKVAIDGPRRSAYAARVVVVLVTLLIAFNPHYVRAAFEDTLGGAMALGMAGAHVALVEDAESMAANPAGLAGLSIGDGTRQLAVNYGGLYLGLSDGNRVTQSYVAYASRVGEHAGIGAGWKRLQGGNLYSEDRIAIAGARRFALGGHDLAGVPRLALGVQGTLLTWDVAPTIGTSGNVLEDLGGPTRVSITAGAVYMLTATESVRVPIGITFRHLNEPDVASGSSTVHEEVPIQTSFGIGAIGHRTRWALDIQMARRTVDVRSGVEWEAHPGKLFLRSGLRLEGLALGTNVTFGASVAPTPTVRIDYAFWLPIGNVSETLGGHRIGVVYAF